MTEKEAMRAAINRVKNDGITIRAVSWVKQYSLEDLPQEMRNAGSFWGIRFDDDRDETGYIEPGFSVFVYDHDGRTDIPVQM